MYMYAFTRVCSAHGGQKKVLDPLELKFQVIASLPTYMVRPELRSSKRAPGI